MIGRIFCILWSHHWAYMYSNNQGNGVVFCTRCSKRKITHD